MNDATLHDSYSTTGTVTATGERIEILGAMVMRYGLALIFLWFGAMKFTSYEAIGVAGFVSSSPLVGWWHSAFGIQGTSNMLGVYEIATGILLLAGGAKPWLSVLGGAMAVIAFLITLSFMFTTPGVAEPLAGGFPAISAVPGGFLLKDLGLLGISLFILGMSLLHARSGVAYRSRNDRLPTEVRDNPGGQILGIGRFVMRYGLALIFVWFGFMKFTSYEATGVAGLIANSPLVGWWHALLGIQGASNMLGVFEITTGVLLALRAFAPIASVVGGAMAIVTFLITLTFFFTTPGVAAPMGFPAISPDTGQFLLKDIGLLGISIWLLGDALIGWRTRKMAMR